MYLILYCIIHISIAVQTLRQVQDQNALCLDGTRASYYFEQGYGDGADKYLIFYEGGGWIQGFDEAEMLQQAYDRSNTNMGSSKFSAATTQMDGLFNRNQNVNPYFYNWNTIFVNYCDGTGHQGYRAQPLQIKDKLIYIRGELIFKSIFQEHLTKLTKASKILVSGCSAGGLAVFSWIQYIKNHLPSNVLVLAAPDSGIFLDLQPYDGAQAASDRRQKQYHKLANEEVDPLNEQCVKSYPNEKWKCHFAQYLIQFINVPIFFMQSLYDTACIPNILHIYNAWDYTLKRCDYKERSCIEAMRKQIINLINDRKLADPKTGAFGVSCLEHCFTQKSIFYTPNWAIPNGSQWTIANSLGQWVQNLELNNMHVDNVYWPENNGCSNI
ncbi:unnamed protein product [Paramecium pentaurelia]|uniref:Pectin acetylesterase n=1 Tax=Paramecium pentaurelia TaxID=43138 RepID=A0A8S1U743_9CILI|nr:unnamed protein product [Paramecium pentaurelia]